jgi:hypothetical protein
VTWWTYTGVLYEYKCTNISTLNSLGTAIAGVKSMRKELNCKLVSQGRRHIHVAHNPQAHSPSEKLCFAFSLHTHPPTHFPVPSISSINIPSLCQPSSPFSEQSRILAAPALLPAQPPAPAPPASSSTLHSALSDCTPPARASHHIFPL